MPLRAEDAALTERDPAFPALSVLLDPESLAERISVLAPDLRGAEAVYLRYKPGTALFVGLVRDEPGSPRSFGFAAAYTGGEAKLDKAVRFAAHSGQVVGVDRPAGLVIGPAATDRALPGLHRVLRRPGQLAPELAGTDLVALRYKPGRRWVGRAVDPVLRATHGSGTGTTALVKLHRPAVAARIARTHRTLREAGAPVPSLLTTDDRRGLIVAGWVPGTALERSVAEPAAVQAAGALLAALHTTAAPGLPTSRGQAGWLGIAVDVVLAIAPEHEDEVRALVQRVALRLLSRPGRDPVPVHGDFSPDQVVLGPRGAGLVDLDRAHAGDPVEDLAGWLAAQATAPGGTGSGLDALARPLLAGYVGAGGTAPGRAELATLTAAAVLGLLDEPFRTRRPDWDRRLTERLTLTRAILEDTG